MTYYIYLCTFGRVYFWWFCLSCFFIQTLFLSPHIQQVNVLFSVLIYGLLLLLLCDIVEQCRLWLPLQTPCHSIPCSVTTGPPWGPYIHSNWFGKDLAAFELRTAENVKSEAELLKRKKKERKKMTKKRKRGVVKWMSVFFLIMHR